ncbi:hypothetical protein YC2023_020059 [Brassica napus]|uniref:Uncharacterized protein n=1 Tax=Brassica oleracea TaxID=3712 RepID=A0A3P6DI26_BRAOL|nr:unnamed protein product [Brassica oleracea]
MGNSESENATPVPLATLMLATVNVNRLATYMPYLKAGRLFLNATSWTHIYFNKETNVGERYFYKLFYSDTGHASAAPLLRGYAKVEPLTIAELNEFGDKNEEELR